ncbi:SCO family protein [Olivibacter sp. SDN3]|uniref:SCO family protein n=1 Tax=Olivibacter sp. SDN3 TaxID=2764720 RepID=UPI0016518B41|nr:SCO family protein [Olivibacter sp. SDN3]QNL51356.1 SCO family protein [Olivibacter sp. SDN3]
MENQPKSSSLKKVLILAAILALPGFCYYLLQEKGENRYQSLPFYGEKKLAGTFHNKRGKQIPDTLYHQVKTFEALRDDSSLFVFNPDSGVTVVGLFYMGNQPLATAINQAMDRLAFRFERNNMVKLLSLTVDPLHDRPQVVASYKQQWKQRKNWYFLIGSSNEAIQTIGRKDFLLDIVHHSDQDLPISHSSKLVLLDSHRRIRGYYDALNKKDIERLIDEVTLLLTEEFRNIGY